MQERIQQYERLAQALKQSDIQNPNDIEAILMLLKKSMIDEYETEEQQDPNKAKEDDQELIQVKQTLEQPNNNGNAQNVIQNLANQHQNLEDNDNLESDEDDDEQQPGRNKMAYILFNANSSLNRRFYKFRQSIIGHFVIPLFFTSIGVMLGLDLWITYLFICSSSLYIVRSKPSSISILSFTIKSIFKIKMIQEIFQFFLPLGNTTQKYISNQYSLSNQIIIQILLQSLKSIQTDHLYASILTLFIRQIIHSLNFAYPIFVTAYLEYFQYIICPLSLYD
ncbi:hypothetical protein pb186bvf_020253 [Paramecium bursaria]